MSTSDGDSAPPNEPTTVWVDVHTKEEESKEDLPGGIQLDPVSQPSISPESITEENAKDEIAPLSTSLATDAAGRLTSQSSVTSDQEPKKERGTVIVGLKSGSSAPSTPKSPGTPRTPGTGLPRRKSSFLRQDSSLSFQDSWRKKDATVRQKSSKNFVSFHNIYYTVPQGRFWEHKPPKVILNNVR